MSESICKQKALCSSLSLSQPKNRRKNVFAEQTPRDGFDETVCFLKKLISLSSLFSCIIAILVFFFLVFFFTGFGGYGLGWWVITRWRWSTTACKSFLWISMDPKRVIHLNPFIWLNFCSLSTELCVSLIEFYLILMFSVVGSIHFLLWICVLVCWPFEVALGLGFTFVSHI